MKTLVATGMVIALVACGSEQQGDADIARETSDSAPPHLTSSERDGGELAADACENHRSTVDAGNEASTDAGVADADAASTDCAPTIGHCLTHMATLCYETSFDDSVACDASGQSSGWRTGPCETGARSSGGCLVGCNVTYWYPLGGGDATVADRTLVKTWCDNVSGTFIDTTPY